VCIRWECVYELVAVGKKNLPGSVTPRPMHWLMPRSHNKRARQLSTSVVGCSYVSCTVRWVVRYGDVQAKRCGRHDSDRDTSVCGCVFECVAVCSPSRSSESLRMSGKNCAPQNYTRRDPAPHNSTRKERAAQNSMGSKRVQPVVGPSVSGFVSLPKRPRYKGPTLY
jgi:hypothetical protein